MKLYALTVDYLKNPLGIDSKAPAFNWKIEPTAGDKDVMQTAYQIVVKYDDKIAWDSGKVESDQSVQVVYAGEELKSCTRYDVEITAWDNKGNEALAGTYFEMGILGLDEWSAEFICQENETEVSPIFKKEFDVAADEIKSARLYITALGLYEASINSKRVGDALFTPGFTSYHNNLYYQTYDITDMLCDKNEITVSLGKGWYRGELGWENNLDIFGDTRALLAEIRITLKNGDVKVVKTDSSWLVANDKVLFSELYHGETYDNRIVPSDWVSAKPYTYNYMQALRAQCSPFTKAIEVVDAVELITTPSGDKVIDFGQEVTGYVEFTVTGKAGDKVNLEHAEVFDSNGEFYLENMRKARNTIDYTLSGEGTEVYHPHFSFQGFRLVRVNEYPGEIDIKNFKAIVVHSEMERTGDFECSDALVNQLQHNIIWGQKGNFLDVPTDCPQRDERLGWTGDAQMFIRTGCFNMDVAAFFKKWLRDLKAEQTDGVPPNTIPNPFDHNDGGSTAWADAAVICPWTIYWCYGNKAILEDQYDSMKGWVDFMHKCGDKEFLFKQSWFGDWLGLDAKEGDYVGSTDRELIATAFFAYSTKLFLEAANVLGRTEDIAKYSELYDNVVNEFNNEFVTPNGKLASNTQTAHVLALMFDLLPEDKIQRAIDQLVALIEERDTHLATGFVGTPYLNLVLSKHGRSDIAYKLLMKTDLPSWLYQVKMGATTIWEHWDGRKEDGSFWSPAMNSFNHYAYGSIGDWLYRVVCGIDILEAGYKKIIIKPEPSDTFTNAKACIDTVYGKVACGWEKAGDKYKYAISIPANTTATVILDGKSYELGSGDYEF